MEPGTRLPRPALGYERARGCWVKPGARAVDELYPRSGRSAQARELLSTNPFINAGFAAGTVRALLRYLREGDRLLNTILRGVLHWGDQVAMGYYLHTNPGTWARFTTAGTIASSSGIGIPIASRRTGTLRAVTGQPSASFTAMAEPWSLGRFRSSSEYRSSKNDGPFANSLNGAADREVG